MAHVICEPCINVKDKACIDVCPVNCIYEVPADEVDKWGNMLLIHPEQCIDCSACAAVCPVTAIFAGDQVPEQWKSYIERNAQFCKEHPNLSPATR